MQKKAKKQTFGTGWVTTDEDERNIRKVRAETEKMSVRFVGDKTAARFAYVRVATQGSSMPTTKKTPEQLAIKARLLAETKARMERDEAKAGSRTGRTSPLRHLPATFADAALTSR
ncbi:MAG: hypothetical protein J6T51_05970 [Kiritimatiellae bacterium]|nr:hypothetical protein [Kiritimatiellia bacterium]